MIEAQARHALYDMLGLKVPHLIVVPGAKPSYRAHRRILTVPDTELSTMVSGAMLVLGADKLDEQSRLVMRKNLVSRVTRCQF